MDPISEELETRWRRRNRRHWEILIVVFAAAISWIFVLINLFSIGP